MNKIALTIGCALSFGLGCSFVLDYPEDSLPCPCKPDFVCLRTSNVCVQKESVDDFKSCSPDAEFPDDLCKQGSRCFDFRDGPMCLPRCVPSHYSTPEVDQSIRAQCGAGKGCFQVLGGGPADGVCYAGECSPLSQDCAPPQQCAAFNLAGVCFTPCRIFPPNAGCIGTQACHPLGASSVTACIETGLRQPGEVCSDVASCAKADGNGRSLVCARPEGSSDQLRCLKICKFGSAAGCDGGEACQFVRPDVDRDVPGTALGVCIGG